MVYVVLKNPNPFQDDNVRFSCVPISLVIKTNQPISRTHSQCVHENEEVTATVSRLRGSRRQEPIHEMVPVPIGHLAFPFARSRVVLGTFRLVLVGGGFGYSIQLR